MTLFSQTSFRTFLNICREVKVPYLRKPARLLLLAPDYNGFCSVKRALIQTFKYYWNCFKMEACANIQINKTHFTQSTSVNKL